MAIDGKGQKVLSFASDVSGLLRERGIELEEGDWLSLDESSPLKVGLLIALDREKVVGFEVGTERLTLATTANSVGEFLKSKESEFGAFNLTFNDPNEPIKTGMVIKAVRLYGLPKTEAPSKLAYLTDRGARKTPAPSHETPSDLKIKETLTLTATAYTPGYDCGYITATGAKAGFGIVAVDPRVIPLGTKVYVEGYGEAMALDTGGAIKGNKIDLCYETYDEAIRFGRRKVIVHILSD
ncbi:MAG: 3D domain-containing protein [Actinomycetota bacterium]|nr:3D domain-containing protein [Actinomycetota bacterium]